MSVETANDARHAGQRLARYDRDGFAFPFPVLSSEQAGSLRDAYWEFRSAHAPELADESRSAQMLVHNQTHLVIDWVAELASRPVILDLVEPMIGRDVAVWHSQWMVKLPGEHGIANAPLPWHQDAVNFAFEPPDAVTVWFALSEATRENGAMQFVPRSHTAGLLSFESNARDERSQVTRGPIVGIDPSGAVDVCLQPGEVSLHHPFLVHASGVNVGREARVAILFRYVPTRVVSIGPHPVEGMLVRGDAPATFRALDPTVATDRSVLQRENLAHMQENAAVVGY